MATKFNNSIIRAKVIKVVFDLYECTVCYDHLWMGNIYSELLLPNSVNVKELN
jgi:uncharacterized protein with PIN domain